jgi:hypothetical protein
MTIYHEALVPVTNFGALERLSFEHLLQWLDHLVKYFDRGDENLGDDFNSLS